MSNLRPYKFLVTAVAQQVDDQGNVTGEVPVSPGEGVPFVIFGVEQLGEWAAQFPKMLEKAASEDAQA